MTIRRLLFLLCLAVPLAACGDSDEDELREDSTESAQVLYNRAADALEEGSYKDAIEDFDEVERLHPYSEWAPRSQILSAFASYRAEDYDDAILTLERFTKLYPGHESAPYAYYLIALSYYDRISDVGRDQGMTKNARKALQDVVRRFPDSDYARDAALKLDLTEDHLAGKEMMVGRYYFEQQEYLAAVNRFKRVIDDYQTTSHTPEALHRLVETYLQLGVVPEAKKYAAVLGHNFPDSDWYRYSYALLVDKGYAEQKDEGWFGDVF